jgi:S1-C subfamily serine protease
VLGGTQADSAGLAPGDVIRTYDGRPVRNEDEYREAMEAAKAKAGAGATVKVGLIQGGKTKERDFRPGPLGIHIEL